MWKKWLIGIVAVATIFRFVGLTHAPPALNWDEVSIGYNAYSILKTGRDEWGKFMPLAFKAFGEEKLPGMIYASVPGIAIFGETNLGVRVTPAVIGTIAVVVMFFLGKLVLDSEAAGLVAAGLLAISPWAVHFSRVSFEAGLAMVLTCGAVYYLIRSHEKPKYLWGAMAMAILAAYTYNSVRILLPLLFFSYLYLGIIKLNKTDRKTAIPALIVGILLCVPIVLDLANPAGRVRFDTVSITSQKGFYDGVSASRGYLASLPSPLPTLIQNKYTHYAYAVFQNYIATFSTEFLFLKGSANTQRSVQGMGLLYLFELPLLVAGIVVLSKKDKKWALATRILVPWLLLAPIPSAITSDAPSSVRALGLLPALILVEAIGAGVVYGWLKKHRRILVVAMLFVIWDMGYFVYQEWYVNPVKYSSDWLWGYEQVAAFTNAHYNGANHIYITNDYGEPYIYTLFYSHYDPAKFQKGPVQRETDPTGFVHVDGFDKYTFTDFGGLQSPSEIVARNPGEQVIVESFATLPGAWHRDLVVQAPDWTVMFEGSVQEGQGKP